MNSIKNGQRCFCPLATRSQKRAAVRLFCSTGNKVKFNSSNPKRLNFSGHHEHETAITARRSFLTLMGISISTLALPDFVGAEEVQDSVPQVVLRKYQDVDIGYSIDIPEGWTSESPGGRLNFFPPHEYSGKRVTIEVAALGKKRDLSLVPLLGSPEQFGESVVAKMGADPKTGLIAEVVSTSQKDDGRYFYYEYKLQGFIPALVLGVAGVGLGPNETARKFNLKQLVTVTCLVPPDASKEDEDLMKTILASFKFLN